MVNETSSPGWSGSLAEAMQIGCCVMAKGVRPKPIQANCPGSAVNPL